VYGIGNLILATFVSQVANYKTSHEKVEDSWFAAAPRKTHLNLVLVCSWLSIFKLFACQV